MEGTYDVVIWEGRVSCRFVPHSSTTVYMDEVVASFDTAEQAAKFIEENEIRLEDEWILEHYGSVEAYNESFNG